MALKMIHPNQSNGRIGLLGTKFLSSASEMDRAVAFYRDIVGLEVATFSPYWSDLTFRNATIALHGGRPSTFCATGLSFTVDDIFAACKAIVDGGGSIRSKPEDRGDEGIFLVMLTDTENNGFMLSQVKNRILASDIFFIKSVRLLSLTTNFKRVRIRCC